MLPGVYVNHKKDGTIYYRSSITYKNKHISLGSFPTELKAHKAYLCAQNIFLKTSYTLEKLISTKGKKYNVLPFQKQVSLINFRDSNMYIKTPVYLFNRYFHYYFSPDDYYIFDIDDLFYYSHHTITRRGGHLFVSDYGMQVNIASRYGIKNHAVCGRDYRFANGNSKDYRYENIDIINRYNGVFKKSSQTGFIYEVRIHIKGEFIVGRYKDETEAAIAYNKAADVLVRKGYDREFPVNYIEDLSSEEYHNIFNKISISKKILSLDNAINN